MRNAEIAAISSSSGLPVGQISVSSATSVQPSSMTLNASVRTPTGVSTAVQYRTANSAGSLSSASYSACTGSPVTGLDVPIAQNYSSGFEAGFTLYYQFKISNTGGFAETDAFSVVTPPDVSTGVASSVTSTSATLGGTVTATGSSASVSFDYAQDLGFSTGLVNIAATPATVTNQLATAVSASATGLQSGRTYYFRVKATNTAGTTTGGGTSFSTLASATTTAATSVTNTTARLNGTFTSVADLATVYFDYSTSATFASYTQASATVGSTTGTNVTAYADVTGLTASELYYVRMRVVTTGGTYTSNSVPFTTQVTSSTSSATSITATTATLNGSVTAGTQTATVSFDYSTNSNFSPLSNVAATPSTVTSATSAVSANITGLSPGDVVYYRVKTVNSAGTYYSSSSSFSTQPTATTSAASSVTTTTATLNGQITSVENSATVQFEYGTSPTLTTPTPTTVAASPSPTTGTAVAVSAAIVSLTFGTTYYFRTKVTSGGYTVYGSILSFDTALAPTASNATVTAESNPTATTGSATSRDTTTMSITSGASVSSGTQSYEYGTTGSYGSTSADGNLTGLSQNTTYYFRTKATRSTMNISASGTVNPQGLSTTVTFEYSTNQSTWTSVAATESPVAAGTENVSVSATLTGLAVSTTYYVRIKAVNTKGTTYSSANNSAATNSGVGYGSQGSGKTYGTFTYDSTVNISTSLSGTPASGGSSIRISGVTLVSGGGGGDSPKGSDYGGGGGGGGRIFTDATTRTLTSGQSMTITVGGGGAGGTPSASGGRGTDSSLSGAGISLTASGGGYRAVGMQGGADGSNTYAGSAGSSGFIGGGGGGSNGSPSAGSANGGPGNGTYAGGGAGSSYYLSQGYGTTDSGGGRKTSSTSGAPANGPGVAGTGGGGAGGPWDLSWNNQTQNAFAGGSGRVIFTYIADSAIS